MIAKGLDPIVRRYHEAVATYTSDTQLPVAAEAVRQRPRP